MRLVVYGIGAIGGTVAAALALSGQEVAGIARGPQLEAIRAGGLVLRTPADARRARFACHGAPHEVDWREDDAVVLTMKSQDTYAALLALRDAGVATQPVVCAQNGVANEPLALRWFPDVYGLTVMMPAVYITPGEVAAFGAPRHGIFDIGRYPTGTDAMADRLVAAFEAAGIAARAHPDIMRSKYGKLIMNLGNIVEAALGEDAEAETWAQRLRDEGRAALEAAGIGFADVAADPRRDALMTSRPIDGVTRVGSSTVQSLARGTGSIETDYLNGEIVCIGRHHGVPTPLNACFCAIARDLIAGRLTAGAVTGAMVEDRLALS